MPGQDELTDNYTSTSLIGAGRAAYGLRWKQNELNKTQWKKFIQGQSECLDGLRKNGFIFETRNKWIYFPVRVEHTLLVHAFREDTFGEALAPFVAAMKAAHESVAEFDKMLKAMPV